MNSPALVEVLTRRVRGDATATSRTVGHSIRPYAVLIAVTYTLLDVLYLLSPHAGAGASWTLQLGVDLVTITAFAALAAAASPSRMAVPGRAHLVAIGMLADLYANNVLQLAVHHNPADLLNIALIVIGLTPLALCGAVWAVHAAAALGVLGWFASTGPPPSFTTYGPMVVVAVGVSFGWLLTQRWVVSRLERAAEDKRQAAALTAATLQQLTSVTESARDAIVTVDSAGLITGWNGGAERMLGRPRESVLGQPVTLLIPPAHRYAHASGFSAALAASGQRPPAMLELDALRADGTTVPVEMSVGAWDADGRRFFSAVLRDLTERRAAEQARRDAAALAARRTDALRLHDDVVQGLTVGLYALEAGEGAEAADALRGTLSSARRIISDALADGEVETVLAALQAPADPAAA